MKRELFEKVQARYKLVTSKVLRESRGIGVSNQTSSMSAADTTVARESPKLVICLIQTPCSETSSNSQRFLTRICPSPDKPTLGYCIESNIYNQLHSKAFLGRYVEGPRVNARAEMSKSNLEYTVLMTRAILGESRW